MRLQIETGRSKTAEFYPSQGKPDDSPAPTVEGVDSDGNELFPEEVIPFDTFRESLTADSDRGDSSLTVGDGTDAVPGRRAWIAPADALGFEVVLRKATDAGAIELLRPLRQNVKIGDIISGHGLRREITETSTAQVGASLIWRWHVNGEEHTKRQWFDIVAAPFDIDLSESDLEMGDWVFGEQIGEYGQITPIVLEAKEGIWRQLVAHGYEDPSAVTVKRDLLQDALKARVRWLRYMKNEVLGPIFWQEYERSMRAVLAGKQWTGT